MEVHSEGLQKTNVETVNLNSSCDRAEFLVELCETDTEVAVDKRGGPVALEPSVTQKPQTRGHRVTPHQT